jgi:integrase
VGRAPLPLGSWGRVRFQPGPTVKRGKPTYLRARVKYRDFDGVTRDVEAYGRNKSAAEANLMQKLRERASVKHGGSLSAADSFAVAAKLWIERIEDQVADRSRSPGTLETYRRQLDNHVLPALGSVRLAEVSTPLLDTVVRTIKREVSATTAKSCRSVISGVLGLAVRHGALASNPVRDIERLEVKAKRSPRALDHAERDQWFAALAANPMAVRADLPDLTLFMLSTGVRIGEALGIVWSEIDLNAGEASITKQVIRITGQGLLRVPTKSSAGERVLRLPEACLEMPHRRASDGRGQEEPVFCDALGGFRDPANVRRDLRNARSPRGSLARRDLGMRLASARRRAGLTQRATAEALGWPRNRVGLIEAGRVLVERAAMIALLDVYGVTGSNRSMLLEIAQKASEPAETDGLGWITSHSFRKTTATMLDDAGLSARQIADQLGHARPSMTQDVYMGRRSRNSQAAEAIGKALGTRGQPKSGG